MSTIGGPNIIEDGLVFGYDADDRSTRFYKGEPTTNLLTNPLMTDKTSWSTLRYPTGTYGPNDGIIWDGDKIKVTKEGGYSNSQTFLVQFMNLTLGQTYTASIMCKTTNPGAVLDVYTGGGWAAQYCTTYTGQWVKLTVTFTVVTSINCQVRCGIYSAGNAIAYFKEFQLEQKSHPTQFTTGTRGATQSLIDLKRTTTIDLSNVSFDSTAHPTFDGSDAIVIPYNNIFNFTTLTCLMWVNPVYAETYQFRGFIGKQGGDRDFNFYAYSISNNNIFDYVHFSTSRLTSYDSVAMLPNALTNGKWHQLGFTIGDGYLKYIYNGEIIKSSAYTGTFNANNSYNLYIGAADNYWIGKLSNILLYNRILTTQEIKNSFNICKSRFSI